MIPYSYDSTTVPRTDVEYPSAYSLFRGDMLQCRQNKPATSPSRLTALQFLITPFKWDLFPVILTTALHICKLLICATQTKQASLV